MRNPSWRCLTRAAVVAALMPAVVLVTTAAAAKTMPTPRVVSCSGGTSSCVATVSIAGGASNLPVIVHLTHNNLKLASVEAVPASSAGSYMISNTKFVKGGSEFQFTLNAVKSNPTAARIILTFSVAGTKNIVCEGSADYCGATVSIAGGASNRQVDITLTNTDFSLVAVRAVPASSAGSYMLSSTKFINGRSEFQFTLNAVKSNPTGARIILLFSAGA